MCAKAAVVIMKESIKPYPRFNVQRLDASTDAAVWADSVAKVHPEIDEELP